MDKTEYPTPQRLRDLRLDGITPFSKPSQYFVASCVLFVCIYLNRIALFRILQDLYALSATPSLEQVPQRLSSLAQEGAELVLYCLVTLVILQLLWGLLQTRALLQPSLLRIDFGRLTSNFKISLGEAFARLVTYSLTFAFFVFLFFLSLAAALWYMPSLLTHTAEVARPRLLSGAELILVAASLFSFTFAFLALFVERFLFLRRHQMSRREIEEEGGDE